MILSIPVLNADTVTPTWEQRQALLRQQGEDEIQRRHELHLAQIKADTLAAKLQLQAGDVNVTNYNNAEASNYTRLRVKQENENQ